MNDPLFVIDGYGLIYRSHFAFIRNPLFNPEGKNSSAVFGFFRTFFNLFKEYSPKYIVVAMDSKTKTFRHEMYEEYKATRDKAPEDLHAQIPRVEEILKELGVPSIRVDGYEADDIIATLAVRCRREKRPCYIVSGDKDLLQLVDDFVQILYPKKGEYRRLDAGDVETQWGVRADQIVDYLSLTGDQSDNIPGIRGIGPKTAVTLLRQYGTLEGIFGNLDEISGSVQKKLSQGRDDALLSRKLIILKKDIDLAAEPEAFRVDSLNTGAALPLFMKEGMKSIAVELSGEAAVSDASGKQERGIYTAVLTEEELDRWIDKVKALKVFVFDVETDNLEGVKAHPVGMSISVEEGKGCYIPLKAGNAGCLPGEMVKEKIRSILTDGSLKLVGQNVKYDYQVMKRWGITMSNIHFDTMIAAWLLDTQMGSYSMDSLAERFLEGYRTIHFKDVVEKDKTFDTVELEAAVEYAAEDADVTFRLYKVFNQKIEQRGFNDLFYTVEMPLVTVLADMELAGIRISRPVLEECSRELEAELSGIEREVYSLCGVEFNLKSTKQLQEILFEKRKLTPIKKIKTGFSTDMSVLEELAKEDRVPELVLRHRMLSKLKSTYVDSLPLLVNRETGRIHTHFIQTGTATGRLSSKDPNLQNIPIKTEEGRKIRKAFVPEEGNVFVSADYSQIELVVLAHLSGDQALGDAFRAGIDVHRQTGARIFGVPVNQVSPEQRRIAKTINFGVMYGMSGFRLSRELGIPRKQADEFIESYFATFSSVRSFIEETVAKAEKEGRVTTFLGRERFLPRITSRNRTEKMASQRIAVNTPIQGTAADIVKVAMLKLSACLEGAGLGERLLLQVHDELIFEVPQANAQKLSGLVKEEMENAVKLSVPLRASVERGVSWGDLH